MLLHECYEEYDEEYDDEDDDIIIITSNLVGNQIVKSDESGKDFRTKNMHN